MRINKFLAQAGVASRRKADALVEEGSVTVNGKKALLGQEINPSDKVLVNGREIQKLQEPTYIMLNKPKGVTSTVYDPHARRTVIDLFKYSSSDPERKRREVEKSNGESSREVYPENTSRGSNNNTRLFPVGRLDQDSTGLILLTNDGELANRLTHPKFHIPKIYEVTILGTVNKDQINQMETGIFLEEGKTAPAKVEIAFKSAHKTILNLTLYEGKKRQIRRMTAALHLHILSLKRIAIGPIKLGMLASGKFRKLSTKEIFSLKKAVKLIK